MVDNERLEENLQQALLEIAAGRERKSHNNTDATQNSRIVALEATNKDLIAKIAAQDSKIAAQGSKIAARDSKIAAQDVKIATLEANITLLKAEIASLKAAIAKLVRDTSPHTEKARQLSIRILLEEYRKTLYERFNNGDTPDSIKAFLKTVETIVPENEKELVKLCSGDGLFGQISGNVIHFSSRHEIAEQIARTTSKRDALERMFQIVFKCPFAETLNEQ